MSGSFRVGAGVASSVVVTFAAYANVEALSDAVGLVRWRIGNTTVPPVEIPLIVKGPSSTVGFAERGTFGFTWQSAPLSPGTCRAWVQWKTGVGHGFCVIAGSLTVLHKWPSLRATAAPSHKDASAPAGRRRGGT